MSGDRALLAVLCAGACLAAATPCLAAPPALRCQHPVSIAGVSDLPASVIAQLHPWMALHGERWSKSDAIGPGELTAGFEWAARSGRNWIVAYNTGGIACCRVRFNLFVPASAASAQYRDVIPPSGAPDLYGDVTCKGIDAALDAYASGR